MRDQMSKSQTGWTMANRCNNSPDKSDWVVRICRKHKSIGSSKTFDISNIFKTKDSL
jgi:hypothetical protein